MNIPQPQKDWTSEDALTLRLFLESDVGRRAMAHVSEQCPALLDGSHMNKTLVRSGEVKGFSAAIEALFQLVVRQPEKQTSSETYPDLDNEAAWAPPSTEAKPAPTPE